MEGRDIGTVVFPDAQVKIFLDADPQERVRRRVEETGSPQDAVAEHIRQRDERDRGRAGSRLLCRRRTPPISTRPGFRSMRWKSPSSK